MASKIDHVPGDQSPSFSGSSMCADNDRPRRRNSDGNKRDVPFQDPGLSKRSKMSDSNNSSGTSSPLSAGSNGNVPVPPSSLSTNVQQVDEGLSYHGRDEIVTAFVSLEPLPGKAPRIAPLFPDEINELEDALEFEASGEGWRDDWAGNLAYIDHDITNPKVKSKEKQSFKQPLLLWALNGSDNLRLVRNLIRYVYHMPNTPVAAKKILAFAVPSPLPEIEKAIRRTAIDPVVLRQDGWTTAKSIEPEGAIGGPFLIGDRLKWQGSDAVVIAYDHDPDIGDLWRAIWTDEEPVRCFDVEAEELLEAKRRWERGQKLSQAQSTATTSRGSTRFAVSDDFSVNGIEYGIVLAASFSKGARPGVYWPARVMHASEIGLEAQGKRSSSKQKLNLMFLAPYWDSNEISVRSRKVVSALSESGDSIFYAGPLFLMETIEATDEMIKEYPYDGEHGLDIGQLMMSFRFTGLPKAAFRRFVDSHRLALGLRTFAKSHLASRGTATDRATAGLFETHPLAVRAPVFPSVVLHLPFQYILGQLPRPSKDRSEFSSDSGGSDTEPVLQLTSIVEMMKPPHCWGEVNGKKAAPLPISNGTDADHPNASTPSVWNASFREANGESTLNIDDFVDDLTHLKNVFSQESSAPGIVALLSNFTQTLSHLSEERLASAKLSDEEPLKRLGLHARSWAFLKSQGEEAVSSAASRDVKAALAEWRRASERVYKYMITLLSGDSDRNGRSVVLSDSRCNEHKTSRGCFERPVRLPAALKAAKLAGAGADDVVKLITSVPDTYVDFVEQKLLNKAHSASYLKRTKGRCLAAKTDDEILVLTDDSDGNGGEDTMGSRGTWKAAVTGVAAAVAGTDMIVRGVCVNAFCITRPPGHHAGRSLHPMKAVSNGFCVLNPVACAAIHATTPISEGGPGLRRVCVIDFDVHHGNGTQDILCSTYDPRYLYVSLHAGGPQVNGIAMDDEDDPNHELHNPGSNSKQSGIFPGRCGDTSPHNGVLNIPLGAKVTSHAVGTALISKVTPAVTDFAPDLIILSAGFDAHKCDPLNLGALAAEDFGHITEVACQLAFRSCSGRLLSVLEGGYSVPCCRPQRDIFTPSLQPASQESNTQESMDSSFVADSQETNASIPVAPAPPPPRPQPTTLLDLGDDLPEDMDDQVPYALQRRLEKCHAEGFIECVREHVRALKRCNKRG